jgi:hypothetical protein
MSLGMAQDIPMHCRCGKLAGIALDVSPASASYIVCHCDDCQAFARHLGREDELDAAMGSHIVQLSPAQLRLTQGLDQLAALRLSDKGMFRWYAACCRTPIANTGPTHQVPFVGLLRAFLDERASDGSSRDSVLGPPACLIYARYAHGQRPAGAHDTIPKRFIARTAVRLAKARLLGKHKPSPFFDAAGQPLAQPTVLSPTERAPLYPTSAAAQ